MQRALLVAALAMVGCAALASPQAPEAILNVVEVVSEIVRRETGKDLEDVPTTCESENHPESGELLLLCTVKYR